MATNTFREDVGGNILVNAVPNYLYRTEVCAFGANLSVTRGQAMGRKTADGKAYPLNVVATDGTQMFEGFSQYTLSTDANGAPYAVFGGTAAGATVYTPPGQYNALVTAGIFDPNDIYTSASGTAVAEVDTFTPASVTTGDTNSVYFPNGQGVEVIIGATQTATAAVTLLTNAWNGNPDLLAVATPSGSTTFILTAVSPGEPLLLTSKVVGTGTLTKVITTAAVSAQQSEVDTFTPTSVTTGDVTSVTINYPNLTTHVVTAAAIGGTATATTWTAALIAAWNADPVAMNYAVASGTTTFILTAVTPGNSMNLTAATVGTGTVAKVVTKPALGRNIADILSSRPGAYVQNITGFWVLP